MRGTKMEGDILISASNYRSEGKKLYVNCLIKKKEKREKEEGTIRCNVNDEILFNPTVHYDSNQREYYRSTDRIGYKAINNGNNNSLITARRTLNSNDASV